MPKNCTICKWHLQRCFNHIPRDGSINNFILLRNLFFFGRSTAARFGFFFNFNTIIHIINKLRIVPFPLLLFFLLFPF